MAAICVKNATKSDQTTLPLKPSKLGGLRLSVAPPTLWSEASDQSLRVSATDLRRYSLCPLSVWYSRQEPFETAAPTLGLAVGEIVHACRAELSHSAWERYVKATKSDDLWSPAIEADQRDRIESIFDRHAFLDAFGEDGRSARSLYTALLLGLECQRALRGSSLLSRGVSGADLASTLLPVEVEVPLVDAENNLVGICDEVWSDGTTFCPVELKTSPPTPAHLSANRAQVAAYASILTRSAGCAVSKCCVNYLTDRRLDTFRYNRTWSRKVDHLAKRVREVRSAIEPPKGMPSREVCAYCPFQAICPQSAAPGVLETMASFFERRCPA